MSRYICVVCNVDVFPDNLITPIIKDSDIVRRFAYFHIIDLVTFLIVVLLKLNKKETGGLNIVFLFKYFFMKDVRM